MEAYSLGIKQHITGLSDERVQKEYNYHLKAKKHMWNSIAQYLHTEENVQEAHSNAGGPLIMDADNLMQVLVGCYICEEVIARSF